MSAAETNELRASLSTLAVSSAGSSAKAKKIKPVVESWEDEASGDDDDTETGSAKAASSPATPPTVAVPSPPPPTPIASGVASPSSSEGDPRFSFGTNGAARDAGFRGPAPQRMGSPSVRPEKTDAVAKRLIAGALGVRAPKRTEEQRAYDRALREKELKRREVERETARKDEEERERARKAAWDD